MLARVGVSYLRIVGDDPIEAISAIPFDRIAAVHLKDWTGEYGRSSHRYARGFVELGDGSVEVGSFLDTLQKKGYSGWVVFEQDCTRLDPVTSIRKNAEWLSRQPEVELKTWRFAVCGKISN